MTNEVSRNAEQEFTSSPSKIHASIKNIGADDAEDRGESGRVVSADDNVDKLNQLQQGEIMFNSKEFRGNIHSAINGGLNHEPKSKLMMASKQMLKLLLNQPLWTSAISLPRTDNSVIVPINDINSIASTDLSEYEQLIRCKLASVYRLIDLLRCSQGIYNHVTARASQEREHFLINPFGLLYHKVTASSLIKVDISGKVIHPGSTTFGINYAGYTIHSAIHEARADLKCVIHLHTPAVVAVSAMKCGLLPLCQEALVCGNVSYHDYRGIVIDQDIKKILVEDLGPINKVMILRNHGFVACGETVEEAWRYAYNMIKASEIQARAVPVGIDQLYLQSGEKEKQIVDVLRGDTNDIIGDKKWKTGELEFECLMRILDGAGYCTGYLYRQSSILTVNKTTAITNVQTVLSASST